MKVPNSFVPRKNLDEEVKKLLECDKKNMHIWSRLVIEDGVKQDTDLFNASLQVLKKAGYERHMFPWEYFGLLVDYYERRLPERYRWLVEDILNSKAEWLSMVVKRTNDKLVCYANPQNLFWDNRNSCYVPDGTLEYDPSLSREFSVEGMKPGEIIPVKEMSDEFIKYIYTMPYDELPKDMKKMNNKFAVPYPDIFLIFGNGYYNKNMAIVSAQKFMAYRGVKEFH